MHRKISPYIALAILLMSTMAVAIAQDSTLPEPLNEEETLALLSETGLNIFPLENITEEPLILENIMPTSASVRFVSSLAANCIIVYGETTDFGQITQDDDMGGFTHTDHHPTMRNLKPDTQYFYRLQGSDVNGNIYTSEILTFHTPPESDEISANLLSADNGAQIIEVSSNWSDQPNDGSFGINNAFDDDPSTAWSSNGDGNDAYVIVQLGERSQINTISFWTRTMSNNTAQIFSFTVTTESGETYGSFELADPEQSYDFEVNFVAETLRFDVVDSNGGNTGAVEIAVYGETASE